MMTEPVSPQSIAEFKASPHCDDGRRASAALPDGGLVRTPPHGGADGLHPVHEPPKKVCR